jgi:hypothetical protein
MGQIPKKYKEAIAEIRRLFDEGTLTPEAFDPLAEKALDAIEGSEYEGELAEGLALYAPVEIPQTDENLEPLGGAAET